MDGAIPEHDSWWFNEPPAGIDRYGKEFEQLFTVYPWTRAAYSDIELHWNRYGTVAEISAIVWPWLPLALCSLYLIVVFGGIRVMSTRKAVQVKPAWRCWNLGLSIFSLFGALRTVPHLAMLVARHGVHWATCAIPTDVGSCWGVGVCGLWVMLFVMSKIPELGDTAFIVLGKKKLLFLHWYHHVTVLLFCWHSYSTRSSSGLWFTTMNYSVHAIMYFYYFLASFTGQRLKKALSFVAPVVTCLQILQMFAGITVLAHVYRVKAMGGTCHTDSTNMWYGIGMYASYAALFVYFAVERYCPCWKRKGSTGKSAKVE
mmetsp:Transcript_46672/g.108773  ORF Transcript_46672/g.108773 Transcript_46672/m.108773 type:complete len:315 (-) Transcript_46672:116-1060(-)